MRIRRNFFLIISAVFLWLVPISQALAVGATLSLSPSTGTFSQGCAFSLAINLDTGGDQTDGTDAIVFYDPTRFSVTSITNGTIYPNYPLSDFSTSGTVKVSGLAAVGSPFTGSGVLATINFQVLSTAPTSSATQVTFDYVAGSTTHSDVAQHGTVAQILQQVVNGSYNIGTSACGTTTTSTPPSSSSSSGSFVPGIGGPTFGSPTPPPILAKSGSEGETIALALGGSLLVVLGIIGIALF